MKDKINQFAKGIFEYETPDLVVSANPVMLSVSAGETATGFFVVKNSAGRVMKGLLSCDCHFISMENDVFQGEENKISFEFDGKNVQPGEVIRGNIWVITDCGSISVSVLVNVKVPSLKTSKGKLRALSQFAELAKEEVSEASELFRDSHFEEVFLSGDSSKKSLYRGLNKGPGRGQAMEEFLIAIHKKLPIKLKLDKTAFYYENCQGEFLDTINIYKDNWGYAEIHISSDSDFLVPEHKIIWTDRFIGNKYPLSFTVNTEYMQTGKNYGRITISSARQNIVAEITAVKQGVVHETVIRKTDMMGRVTDMTECYLDFCMDRSSKDEYLEGINKLANRVEAGGKTFISKLFKIHIGILEVNDEVEAELNNLEQSAASLRQTEPVLFCAYQYLKGLWNGDKAVRQECLREVRRCYEMDNENWKIFWFLLYLDPAFENDYRKYEIICEQLRGDCHSPVMYFEVCNILNESPELLKGLEPGVMLSLHWGCKKRYLEKETALRYVYLAGRQKLYSKIIIRDMELLYEQYQDDEILTVICKLLMYGQLTSKKAFKWYSLGLERNLKITDLYEYYMYSLDETQEIHLTKAVLLYFLYDNHLTMVKKAMLYRYVIQNKEQDEETYSAYREVMKEFAEKQLKEGRISHNLAVIYEEFINEESINNNLAKWLPEVMFTHEITCYHPDIVGVYVRHRELEGEEFVPLVQGKAVVSLFTEQAKVFLADGLDNRYYEAIDYIDRKLLHLDHLADKCFSKNSDNVKLLLHLYDRYVHMNSQGENMRKLRGGVLAIPNLDGHTRRKVFAAQIRDYYDSFEGELLDHELVSLDWGQVSVSERASFIEYLSVRHCNEKAMEGILQFGYDKFPANRVMKVATETLQRELSVENPIYVKLAWNIFKGGSFDENILNYLCSYYNGGLSQMIRIWEAAHTFSLSVDYLSERILAQSLFTGEMLPEVFSIFYDYYDKGTNKRLCHGFLNYLAYRHLVHNWVLPNKLFEYYVKEAKIQENIPCLLAVLRHYSMEEELSGDEVAFCDYNVNMLYKRGIVMPFFKDFYGKFSLPRHLLYEYYVTVTANPRYELKIHYRIFDGDESKEFVVETMHDVFQGIRVQGFVLFRDENLQYYITECRPEGDIEIKRDIIKFDGMQEEVREESHYFLLNMMMIAHDLKDEAALQEMMISYASRHESIKKMFVPVGQKETGGHDE